MEAARTLISIYCFAQLGAPSHLSLSPPFPVLPSLSTQPDERATKDARRERREEIKEKRECVSTSSSTKLFFLRFLFYFAFLHCVPCLVAKLQELPRQRQYDYMVTNGREEEEEFFTDRRMHLCSLGRRLPRPS
jgi:hypothetical protein